MLRSFKGVKSYDLEHVLTLKGLILLKIEWHYVNNLRSYDKKKGPFGPNFALHSDRFYPFFSLKIGPNRSA